MLPELVFSIFGLYAGSSLDLPSTTSLTQSRLKQFKWGADATLYPLTWLGFMLRGDIVEYDIGYGGYISPLRRRAWWFLPLPVERAHLPPVLALQVRRQDGAERRLAMERASGGREQRAPRGPLFRDDARPERRQDAGRDRFLIRPNAKARLAHSEMSGAQKI